MSLVASRLRAWLAVAPMALALASFLHAQPAPPAASAIPSAGPFIQQKWTVENGLPQGSILDLAQTPDGYLWIGTYGGLVRFDGLHFTLIDGTTLPSLASNQVQAVRPALQGGVWVAAVGARIFRTDGRQELEALPERPHGEGVRRLAVGPDGTLWSASETAVARYLQGRWSPLEGPDDGLGTVRTLRVDHSGAVWVGTTKGLFRGVGDRAERFVLGDAGAASEVRAVFEDRERRMWIGGSRGLSVIESEARVGSALPVPGIDELVTAITQAGDGRIWLATPSGLFVLEWPERSREPSLQRVASAEELGGSRVVRLLAAKSGAVVAGTTDAGFRVFTPRVFDLLARDRGLPEVTVHHVAPDGDKGAWVGAACGGLTHLADLSSGTATVYRPPALGLRNPCVRGLLRDRRGALWVGQARGTLTRIDAAGGERTWDTALGLPMADIGPLLEDREGRLWAGTGSGIVCRVDRDDRLTCPGVTLPGEPQAVWSLAEDEDGSLWIGQVGRVTRVSAGGMRTWTIADGVPPVAIRVLHPRPSGTMWLGTYGGGLARLRADRIASITSKQGLFDNAISAMVAGDQDDAWLLGNRGVFATRWAALDATADAATAPLDGATFGPADGVPEGNGGHPAAARLGGGHIGFASVQGLVVVDPRRLRPASPPAVIVEDVLGARRMSASDSTALTVPAGGGPVEIRLAAPSIGAVGAVGVRYQLSGRDNTWMDAGADRHALYSGLSPGAFQFRVSSRVAGAPWSEPSTALTLRVLPFWWQTWWARLLAAAAVALALGGLVRLRIRGVERRNEALEREIRQRQRAEEESHKHLLALAHVGRLATAGELAASITHDLNQPLAAIVANAEASRLMLTRASPDPASVTGILAEIKQQGLRASDIMGGLKRFLGRGQPALEELDLARVVPGVMGLLESTLASARVRLVLDLPDDLPSVRADRVPLEQVVVNLSLNAVEAMRERPQDQRCLLVRARHTPRHVRVSVLDTGPGLRGRSEVLFEPFHTTKPGGMGMGLAICRSIVGAHGGHIRARNRPAGGAVFSFTLPLDVVRGASTRSTP